MYTPAHLNDRYIRGLTVALMWTTKRSTVQFLIQRGRITQVKMPVFNPLLERVLNERAQELGWDYSPRQKWESKAKGWYRL